MPYDFHIGVDYHKAYSHLVVQDDRGRVLRSGRVSNNREHLQRFLKSFPKEQTQAVMEATRNWCVMHDWLEELVDNVVLAHPLKVKAIADAKIKTDKIDATALSHLLRADLVPIAHAPKRAIREQRIALRERMFYVRLRTMTKNRVVGTFDRYPEETSILRKVADLFGREGRAQLKKLPVSEVDRIVIDRSLALIDEINKNIKSTEKTIRLLTRKDPNVKLLLTIPGIGEYFARLIMAEIDYIDRFPTPKKLAAYAGLVPSTYSSGGKTFNGRIIKAGNKWLRWAFVEAIAPAVSHDPGLKAEYERLKARKGPNKAKVAMARRLLTIAFCVLREKRPYRPHVPQYDTLSTKSRLS